MVLQNISFIHKEGVLGIVGSNGSGKSTLLKCMSGLWKPSKGDAQWQADGKPLNIAQLKQYLGYAAPYINLYNELTCDENLRFLLRLRNYSEKSDQINKALERTSMKSFIGQPYGSLSTGQQQRMCISAALVHQPDVLFLDEPGSNLDEAGQEVLRSIVSEFKEARKLTVIASNNREELKLCNKIYSVEKGEFLEL